MTALVNTTDGDGEAFRERLKSKETVFLGFSIKKCAHKFATFVSALQGGSKTACTDAREAAAKELQLYSLEVGKADLVAQTCIQQINDYESLEREVKDIITSTESSIETLTQELTVAKVVRQHKEQYEALSKVVNKHSSKAESLAAQAEVEAKLQQLNKEQVQLASQIKLRNLQFALLMQTIEDLKQTLNEDETKNQLDEKALITGEIETAPVGDSSMVGVTTDTDSVSQSRRRTREVEEGEEEEDIVTPSKRLKSDYNETEYFSMFFDEWLLDNENSQMLHGTSRS
eukprot:CAMPEP_0185770568 /NCGR_PEP_ID=MMETSP1174-20130828/59848_1 /TAXON_ID=35687 /ORGANISM="Dictyocha speculum, Strain CCMP1381" /LENGTH=286 /DNA_ID=CAMNT_0028456057 /DNA_START=19 /DNA_END=877 /DNA_ORIENTATION=-